MTKLFNQSRFRSTMQLQSSLFSRGVLLGLHDFSIQSTVVLFLQKIEFLYMQILLTGASRIPEAFHAQFPVFATPRPTKLLVAREKKPLPKVAEVFCRRAAVSTAVLTTTPCARWAPNEKKNAVSQRLECCHLLLMSFRMVSAYFLSSLSTQE